MPDFIGFLRHRAGGRGCDAARGTGGGKFLGGQACFRSTPPINPPLSPNLLSHPLPSPQKNTRPLSQIFIFTPSHPKISANAGKSLMDAPKCRTCGERHWSRLCEPVVTQPVTKPVTPSVTVTKPVTAVAVPCPQCAQYEAEIKRLKNQAA